LILDLIDFDRRIAGADLVVTGEGSLDDQSLAGKAPVGVARAAARAEIPVIAVAGRLQLSPSRLREAGISAAYPLTDLEPDLDRCIANAGPLLRRVGAADCAGLARIAPALRLEIHPPHLGNVVKDNTSHW
jgi:glycerate 2-kinase